MKLPLDERVNKAEVDPWLELMSFKTGPASVAGRPVAKPLQLVLQRSDSRLGKGGASFGLGGCESRRLLAPGFGLQGFGYFGRARVSASRAWLIAV